MEKTLCEPSSHLPLAYYNINEGLKLEGRSIPEDAGKIYNPIIEFVDQLNVCHLIFNINLDYFNTASSKKLLELLKHLDANNKLETVLVNWHFEEGDDDSLETAEIYEECLRRTKFRYIEYAEVA
jgi:hypothetical protein